MVEHDGAGVPPSSYRSRRSKETVEESWDMAAGLPVLVLRHHYLPIHDVAKVHSEIYLYCYPTLTKYTAPFPVSSIGYRKNSLA